MGKTRFDTLLFAVFICSAAISFFQPVQAINGTISIAYRGSGGGNIGDTIIFDGHDTFGNTSMITITGPGLPPEGLPLDNLNGLSGSGNSVEVNPDGFWKFVWYTAGVKGVEKLQTARYIITISDTNSPDKSAFTSVMMKKPDFFITISPNPVTPGNYVQLIGTAENGITFAKIEVTDASGTVYHTFTSPVSSSGYMNYGFHVDMKPGQYVVTMSNPGLKTPYRTVMKVMQPPEPVQDQRVPIPVTLTSLTNDSGAAPEVSAYASLKKPSMAPLSPILPVISLIVSGAIALLVSSRQKKSGRGR